MSFRSVIGSIIPASVVASALRYGVTAAATAVAAKGIPGLSDAVTSIGGTLVAVLSGLYGTYLGSPTALISRAVALPQVRVVEKTDGTKVAGV